MSFKYYFKNGFWVGASQGVSGFIGLLLAMTFARLATPEFYGQYQLVLSIVAMVAVISLPGLGFSLLRAVSRGFDGNYDEVTRVKFFWSLWGSLILFLIAIYYWFYGDTILMNVFLLVALFFPLMFTFNIWNSFMQGKERFDMIGIFLVIESLVFLALMTLTLIYNKSNLLGAVGIFMVSSTAFNFFWFKRSRRLVANNKKEDGVVDYGKFLTKLRVLNILVQQIDKIIVGFFVGVADLAFYSIGTGLVNSLFDKLQNFMLLARPQIARSEVIKFWIYCLVFVLFLMLAMVFYWLLPLVIPLFFSEQYQKSIVFAQTVIMFMPFLVVGIIYRNYYLLSLGNRKILFWEAIIFPCGRLVLMFVLFFYFGVMGLAWATGLQFVMRPVILWSLSRVII